MTGHQSKSFHPGDVEGILSNIPEKILTSKTILQVRSKVPEDPGSCNDLTDQFNGLQDDY